MTSLVGIQVENSMGDVVIEPYSFITTIEIGDNSIHYSEATQPVRTQVIGILSIIIKEQYQP